MALKFLSSRRFSQHLQEGPGLSSGGLGGKRGLEHLEGLGALLSPTRTRLLGQITSENEPFGPLCRGLVALSTLQSSADVSPRMGCRWT